MQLMTQPIVRQYGGDLVKYEADNLLAVFESVDEAVSAAIAMKRAAEIEDVEKDRKISFSIGLDTGKIILLEEVDCFGDAVNLAHKLGEDLASPGEILITAKAYQQLSESNKQLFEGLQFKISGISLEAYRTKI